MEWIPVHSGFFHFELMKTFPMQLPDPNWKKTTDFLQPFRSELPISQPCTG